MSLAPRLEDRYRWVFHNTMSNFFAKNIQDLEVDDAKTISNAFQTEIFVARSDYKVSVQ